MTQAIHKLHYTKLANGYAVLTEPGVIMVETVSPTLRAVKVNALVAIAGVPVLAWYSDKEIDDLFDMHCDHLQVTGVAITC